MNKTYYDKYLKVKKYKEENGHFPISADVENCGVWLKRQCLKYKKGLLPDDEKALLDTLGDWLNSGKEINDIHFNEQLAKVKKYLDKHNTFPLYDDYENAGVWLSRQRLLYSKNKLDDSRILLLNTLGNWKEKTERSKEEKILRRNKIVIEQNLLDNEKVKAIEDYENKNYYLNFLKVKNYLDKNNTFPITTDRENGGRWLYVERMKLKNGTLSEEKKALLDTLGDWVNQYEQKKETEFDKKLLKIKEYVYTYHKLPAYNDKENGGTFLGRMRYLYNQGLLDEEKIAKLQQIEGSLDGRCEHERQRYLNNLEIVREYMKKNNKLPNKSDVKNKGSWLNQQLIKINNNTLNEEYSNIIKKFYLEIKEENPKKVKMIKSQKTSSR